ncbi:MAG TPA: hypothetical protein VK525_11645 [Candidatus Saccharimonadales bacterium]|nr:hypothetical protein [Candidatus Saccharimonadales bacterium]
MPLDTPIAPRSQIHDGSSVTVEESDLAFVLVPENKTDTVQLNETNFFAAQSWHLPYAEALIEDVLPFLPISIVLAESAILNRYLELHDIAGPLEERIDLRRAVNALLNLKMKTL